MTIHFPNLTPQYYRSMNRKRNHDAHTNNSLRKINLKIYYQFQFSMRNQASV